MNDNTRYWLWFAYALRPGNERIWQMISPYGNVKEAYEAVFEGEHPSLSRAEKQLFKRTHIEQCDRIIEYCEKNNYIILTFEDEDYPYLLRNIYNPPAVLFCMGDMSEFNRYPAVSCVGTRNPSKYSLEVTEKICKELARREFTVVSGFALGLDSAAHKGAINAGGRTAAVLACGINVDYPKENGNAKRLVAQKGFVITEYFPDTHPDKYCFHIRNRIISGLTFGTLVTEADERSGSLITAEHATRQGRTVFCIPPADIFDKRYAGVVKYLRDGAVPVFSHLDILYDYYTSSYFRMVNEGFSIPEIISEDNDIPKRDSRSPRRKKKGSDGAKAPKNTDAIKERDILEEQQEELLCEMNEEQTRVVKALEGKNLMIDELIDIAQVGPMNILAVLTELEIMGVVEMKEAKKYGLAK